MSKLQKNHQSETRTKKDRWDIVQIFCNCAIPLVIGVVGWLVNSTLQKREDAFRNREINLKFVEVAVEVLRSKPEESNFELRGWAAAVMNRYSEVALSQKAIDILKTNALPVVNYLTTDEGKIITTEDGKRIQLDGL